MYLIQMRLADGKIRTLAYKTIAAGERDAKKHGANIQAVQKAIKCQSAANA